jgi:Dolichol phosphate-mannose biosynthesis regulatory protein (DPM2)
VDEDHPLHDLFPPREYAIKIPALFILLLLAIVGTFVSMVMIKSDRHDGQGAMQVGRRRAQRWVRVERANVVRYIRTRGMGSWKIEEIDAVKDIMALWSDITRFCKRTRASGDTVHKFRASQIQVNLHLARRTLSERLKVMPDVAPPDLISPLSYASHASRILSKYPLMCYPPLLGRVLYIYKR